MCDDDEDDESLKDTACSSAVAQQVTMENLDCYMKQMTATDTKQFNNMPQLMVSVGVDLVAN